MFRAFRSEPRIGIFEEDRELITETISEAKGPGARSIVDRHIRTVAKGGSVVLAGKLFTQGCRLLLALLLARLLAAEHYGLYNLALTVAEVLAAFAALGLGTALVRYIAQFSSRKDAEGLRGTLQVGVGIPVALSLVMAIALYLVADPIANRILHDPRSAPLLRLISLLVPFMTLNDMVAAATRGLKNMHYTVIAQYVAHPLIKLGLMVGIAVFGLTAWRAVLASGLTEVLITILLIYFMNKQVSLRVLLEEARREPKELLKFSLPVYFSGLLNTFGRQILTLILAGLTNVYNVGIFALVTNLTWFGGMFNRSITMSSQPVFAELFSEKRRHELARLYQATTRWTFSLNLPLFLILVLLPKPILALFGESFAGAVPVLVLSAWQAVVYTSTGMCTSVLDMTGHTLAKLIGSIIRVVFTIGLSAFLIPRWGVLGAAAAALGSQAAEGVFRLAQVYFLFKVLPFDRTFWKPIAAAVAAAISVLVTTNWIPQNPLFMFAAAEVTILLLVYIGVNLALGLPPEEHKFLLRLRDRASTVLARI